MEIRPLNQICMVIFGEGGGNTTTSILRILNKRELISAKHFAEIVDEDRRFLLLYPGTETPNLQGLLSRGKPISFEKARDIFN